MARILVIDDEPSIRSILRSVLEPRGHEVILGDDGLRGVGMAQRQRPDAIILDLMMPVVDGHEVMRMLGEQERTREIPVIVLTALTQAAVRERCLAEGAFRVLTKPFDPQDLGTAVGEALSRSTS